MLVLELSAQACPPTDSAVGTDHVWHGSSRFCCFKNIGPCNQIGNLIPTPAVSLYANIVLVYKPLFYQRSNSGNNAVICTFSWIAYAIFYIRIKDYVASTRIETVVD